MKVLIAGDYCPQHRLYQCITINDFETMFPESLRNIVQSVDYSVVNMECAVADDIYVPVSKCGPNLYAPSSSINALKYAGFMCCTIANNHISDYGSKAFNETVLQLKSKGFDYVGGVKTCLKLIKHCLRISTLQLLPSSTVVSMSLP